MSDSELKNKDELETGAEAEQSSDQDANLTEANTPAVDPTEIGISHKMELGQNPPNQQYKVELPRVLDLGCGILLKLIVNANKVRSKEIFKRLKSGEKVFLGEITVGGQYKIKLNLLLNAKEFVGPGFNSEVFKASVDQLLKKIAPRLRAKQDLSIRSNQAGTVMFDLPAGIRVKGQLNVMVMFMDLSTRGQINMSLNYMDPTSFLVKE